MSTKLSSVEDGKVADRDVCVTSAVSLRELIAMHALQGILAHSHNDSSYDGAARDAVVHADHLLAELSK